MNNMAWEPLLDPVKILKCKVCDREVNVNANYPITEVTCKDCYEASKNDKNLWGDITRYQGLSYPPGGVILNYKVLTDYNYCTNSY